MNTGRAIGVFIARDATGEGFCCLLDPLLDQVHELRASNDAFAQVRNTAAAVATRHTRSPEGWTYVQLGLELGKIPDKKKNQDSKEIAKAIIEHKMRGNIIQPPALTISNTTFYLYVKKTKYVLETPNKTKAVM